MTRKRRLAHVRRSMEASKPKSKACLCGTFGDSWMRRQFAATPGPWHLTKCPMLVREAIASVALDHDPDYGTHSVDDGCPGGHRGCTDAQPCRHPELRWVHSQACRGTT